LYRYSTTPHTCHPDKPVDVDCSKTGARPHLKFSRGGRGCPPDPPHGTWGKFDEGILGGGRAKLALSPPVTPKFGGHDPRKKFSRKGFREP